MIWQKQRVSAATRPHDQDATMKPTNSMLSGLPTTIFSVMSALAVEHDAINLGQGFPDTEGPMAVSYTHLTLPTKA